MSDRVRQLLEDAARNVPDRPGNLEAVRKRARQRTTRQRAGSLLVVALLLAAVASVLPGVGRPRPPVIGPGEGPVLTMTLCADWVCDGAGQSGEEAATIVRDDSAVAQVRIISGDEIRRQVAESNDRDIEDLPEFPPALEVSLDLSADDTGPTLLDVAARLREKVPGSNVRTGRFQAPRPIGQPHEPSGPSRPAQILAEATVGAETVGLEAWSTRDGGVCMQVRELKTCGANLLLRGGTAGASSPNGYGNPLPTMTCVWGSVGIETQEMTITFADGRRATAELALAPDFLLSQAYLACAAGSTAPVKLETKEPDGSSGHESSGGGAVVPEVRPEGSLSKSETGQRIADQLDVADLHEEFKTADNDAEREELLAAFVQKFEAASEPERVERLEVADSALAHGPDARLEVAVEVYPFVDRPFCLRFFLGETDGLMYDTQLIWTQNGCPPLQS